jgi:hypothetical protein
MYERIIKEEGDLRVKIVLDECPSEPFNDGGCPVIRVDSDYPSARFEHTGYGSYYDPGFDPESVLARLEDTFGWREAIEVFERYVRIFHEGSVATYHLGWSREYGYVAFTTRTLARAWGIADDRPVPEAELNEWRAYVEGDVWGYVVERKVDLSMTDCDVIESWEEVDSCWGFYGEEWAEQAAVEALDDEAEVAA